ncbi:hypothetical protein ACEF17_13270 [Streptococcus hyovaginalis]
MNLTYNIDTGPVFGGKFKELKYPELPIESVPARMPLVEEKYRTFVPEKAKKI